MTFFGTPLGERRIRFQGYKFNKIVEKKSKEHNGNGNNACALHSK
jgi:hypothetical protein